MYQFNATALSANPDLDARTAPNREPCFSAQRQLGANFMLVDSLANSVDACLIYHNGT